MPPLIAHSHSVIGGDSMTCCHSPHKVYVFVKTLLICLFNILIVKSILVGATVPKDDPTVTVDDADKFNPNEHQDDKTFIIILLTVFLGGPILITVITCILAVCLCRSQEKSDKNRMGRTSRAGQGIHQQPQRVAMIPPQPILPNQTTQGPAFPPTPGPVNQQVLAPARPQLQPTPTGPPGLPAAAAIPPMAAPEGSTQMSGPAQQTTRTSGISSVSPQLPVNQLRTSATLSPVGSPRNSWRSPGSSSQQMQVSSDDDQEAQDTLPSNNDDTSAK